MSFYLCILSFRKEEAVSRHHFERGPHWPIPPGIKGPLILISSAYICEKQILGFFFFVVFFLKSLNIWGQQYNRLRKQPRKEFDKSLFVIKIRQTEPVCSPELKSIHWDR